MSKLTISKHSLKKALREVSPVVKPSPIVPILECVMVETTKERVTVTASDLQSTITTYFASDEDLPNTSFCIPYAKVKALLDKIDQTFIEITLTETEDKLMKNIEVTIHFGKNKATVGGEDPKDWPNVPEIDMDQAKTIVINSDQLIRMIQKTEHSRDNDELRPSLTGFHLTDKFLETSNGHVLSRFKIHNIDEGINVILNSNFASLKNIFTEDQPVSIYIANERVKIEGDCITWDSRNIDERFPDTSSFFPDLSGLSKLTVKKKSLLSEIDRAFLFADTKEKHVRLSIKPMKMEVYSKNKSFNEEYSGELEIDYSQDDLDIGVNAALLSSGVKVCDEEDIVIYHSSAENKPLFIEAEDYTCLVLPVYFK